MGAVYRGEHVHMRKLVLLVKGVCGPRPRASRKLVARFEREAIAGAHVDHPNVASATDFGRMPDGAFFLVLEFVDGLTLRQRMKAGLIASLEGGADRRRQLRRGARRFGHAMDSVCAPRRQAAQRDAREQERAREAHRLRARQGADARPSVAPRPAR